MKSWQKPAVNLLIEFGPVTAFFIAYRIHGFFFAVGTLMLATFISVAAALVRDRRLAWFPLFGFSMVMIFGSLSFFVHDPRLFILRDTIADLTFGTILLVSLLLNKPALKPMFEASFAITDEGWRLLTFRWMILYYGIGCINEFIRQTHTAHFWIDFKLVSVLITIVFGLYQFRLTRRTRIPAESNSWGMRIASRHTEKEMLRTNG